MLIDNQLGGTTSLEVVLDGKKKDHWLESENLELLRKIHQYSEQLPDVGKVLSLHTLIEVLTGINNGIPPIDSSSMWPGLPYRTRCARRF